MTARHVIIFINLISAAINIGVGLGTGSLGSFLLGFVNLFIAANLFMMHEDDYERTSGYTRRHLSGREQRESKRD